VILRRVEGPSRIDTAVAVSQEAFADGAETVVLARADDYPDALAGGPFAVRLDAPILLSARNELSPATADEISRLGARRVVMLGGEAALRPEVVAGLVGLGVTDIDRVSGPNRFATAAEIARRIGGSEVFVTEGSNADPSRGWPDAMSAAPYAAFLGRPILLVSTDTLPQETLQALDDLRATDATLVGGAMAISPAVEQAVRATGAAGDRLAGETRYETSRLVAQAGVTSGMDPALTWFATGRNYPDALVSAPAVVESGGVLLLLDGDDLNGSPPAGDWLTAHSEELEVIRFLGGVAAISNAVQNQVADRLG